MGKIVHAAANKYLTPVTLELGGKRLVLRHIIYPYTKKTVTNGDQIFSPCYIDNTADIGIATRRVLWGKLINSGQTCIAPDYLLCTKEVEKKFLAEAKIVLEEWYGKNQQDSPDLCRIINQTNFQ